jgi:hypothetical protein
MHLTSHFAPMELKWVCNPSSHIRSICSNHIPLGDWITKEVTQLSQILHLKLLLQKFFQIKDVCITISYDNQVINIDDYDYNPMICLFHIFFTYSEKSALDV